MIPQSKKIVAALRNLRGLDMCLCDYAESKSESSLKHALLYSRLIVASLSAERDSLEIEPHDAQESL